MKSFIETVDQEADLIRQITTKARRFASHGFGDLLWDEASFLNFHAIVRDPGVRFETDSRIFALEHINGELRYYAGDKSIYADDYEYELGVFATIREALSFAVSYLIDEMRLTDIKIIRDIRSKRSAT